MKNKVTGEEKHYQKLNKRLSQELNDVRMTCAKLEKTNVDLFVLLVQLKYYTDVCVAENQELKKHLNLTDEEVTHLMSVLKKFESLHALLTWGRGGFGQYGI